MDKEISNSCIKAEIGIVSSIKHYLLCQIITILCPWALRHMVLTGLKASSESRRSAKNPGTLWVKNCLPFIYSVCVMGGIKDRSPGLEALLNFQVHEAEEL